MTNFFNSYFINVIPELINNHDLNVDVDPLSFISYNQNSFFFVPATEYEVNIFISAMKSKPTNIHDILLNVLKYISKPISKLIAYIYNLCIERGKYSDTLKYARVTPVHKLGDKMKVSNYQ